MRFRMNEMAADSFQITCPAFETPRLRLRMLQPGDEEFLALLDSDADVMKYIHSGPLTQKSAIEWARMQVEMAPQHWHLHKWMVEMQEGATRVGWVELSKFRGVFDPNESRLSDDVNLGYQFAPTYWNQGFACESIRPVLSYAFDTLQLQRLVAFTHKDNVRSQRVLEKLGFRERALRHYRDQGGNACRLYALTPGTRRPLDASIK